MIHFIKRSQIDTLKWDTCISNSKNPHIYAYSWYLDCFCDNWGAIVENDYDVVFPIPYKIFLSLKYIYQPIFCQQLGFFSKDGIVSSEFENYVLSLVKKFISVDLLINREISTSFIKNKKRNYILNLNKSYESITNSYSRNHQKNIAKSKSYNLKIVDNSPLLEIIKIYQNTYGNKNKAIKQKDYQNIEKIFQRNDTSLKHEKWLVYDNKNNCLGGAIFLINNSKIYYLIGAPTIEGRKKNIIYFLIDQLIQKYANSSYFLDFEGSEIPGVAYFYEGFGAEIEYYYHFQSKKLSFL